MKTSIKIKGAPYKNLVGNRCDQYELTLSQDEFAQDTVEVFITKDFTEDGDLGVHFEVPIRDLKNMLLPFNNS